MDEEELRLDIAEALGKTNALISFQAAFAAMLVSKEILTIEDAAELTGTANAVLAEMEGLSDGVRILAQSALRGIARVYTKRITRN